MSAYLVTFHGDPPEDGRRVEAADPEDAALEGAEEIDSEGDCPTMRPDGLLVDVYQGDPPRLVGTWRVWGELVPRYSAREEVGDG